MSKNFDLVIIGGGPGGYVAAIRASQLGIKVALVEKEQLGGVCLNWGCIPTKTLLKISELYHSIQNAEEFGIKTQAVKFDLDAVVANSRAVVRNLSRGIESLMQKNKISVYYGHARLAAKNKISIKSKQGKNEILHAKNIIIATGARPRQDDKLAVDGKLILSYKEAMVPKEIPKSLLIVGSGAIGMEFASFYSVMGSNVTVIELQDRILPAEDKEISTLAHKIFTKQGININTNSCIKELKKVTNYAEVKISSHEDGKQLKADKIILAIGVVGNIDNLGLQELGVHTKGNQITTNDKMETNIAGIYAIGDVAGPPWLAHKASHEGIACVENIAGQHSTIDKTAIPGCTYCYPQIASVGLTENLALEKGHKIKVGRFPYAASGKALAIGEHEGLVKVIFDKNTGELLGAHIIGADASELIQGCVIGKRLEITDQDFRQIIFPHPTLSEMLHEAVLDADDEAIHS
jgi:dihydrolipoamide dehydrogenase